MSWQPGDEIIIPTGEFPSNIWPWKSLENQGVIIHEVPLWEGHRGGADALNTSPPRAGHNFEDSLLSAVSPQTRLIAVSWVRFQDGLKLDLRNLADGCQEKGIVLVVDGIQGAGTLPELPEGISAFTTGAHKGLLTPQGSGFLWTSPKFRSKLKPMGSWLSVEGAMDFSRPNSDANRHWNTDGSYLEQGVPNLLGCTGFLASLKYINHFTTRACHKHVRALQEELLISLLESETWGNETRRLLELHRERRLGSVLSFFTGHRTGFTTELLEQGLKLGIHASTREGYLRIALHGWHNSSDILALHSWLTSQS
jgi:selenocysteine lyase/cysteine desulfurase